MTGSWWTVPCVSRADFDKRAAEEALRMAASQEGHRLTSWTSNVGPQPAIHRVTAADDVECTARR